MFARKRPRLRPIWDSVVAEVTHSPKHLTAPLHKSLAADGRELHDRLIRLREQAGLPEQVSALRVFDVVCWMEGKTGGCLPPTRPAK